MDGDNSQPENSSEEAELLQAIHLKAEAFASNDWEAYWAAEGPKVLASGWLNVYPSIPLDRVEQVCAIDFLCQAVRRLELNGEVEEEVEEGERKDSYQGEVRDDGQKPEDLKHEQGRTDGGMAVESGCKDKSPGSDSQLESNEGACVDSGGPVAAACMSPPTDMSSTTFSDVEIATLWHEHYNSYYWYCFQQFKQWQQDTMKTGEDDGGEVEKEMAEVEGEKEGRIGHGLQDKSLGSQLAESSFGMEGEYEKGEEEEEDKSKDEAECKDGHAYVTEQGLQDGSQESQFDEGNPTESDLGVEGGCGKGGEEVEEEGRGREETAKKTRGEEWPPDDLQTCQVDQGTSQADTERAGEALEDCREMEPKRPKRE